jgi:hypothetical protein
MIFLGAGARWNSWRSYGWRSQTNARQRRPGFYGSIIGDVRRRGQYSSLSSQGDCADAERGTHRTASEPRDSADDQHPCLRALAGTATARQFDQGCRAILQTTERCLTLRLIGVQTAGALFRPMKTYNIPNISGFIIFSSRIVEARLINLYPKPEKSPSITGGRGCRCNRTCCSRSK